MTVSVTLCADTDTEPVEVLLELPARHRGRRAARRGGMVGGAAGRSTASSRQRSSRAQWGRHEVGHVVLARPSRARAARVGDERPVAVRRAGAPRRRDVAAHRAPVRYAQRQRAPCRARTRRRDRVRRRAPLPTRRPAGRVNWRVSARAARPTSTSSTRSATPKRCCCSTRSPTTARRVGHARPGRARRVLAHHGDAHGARPRRDREPRRIDRLGHARYRGTGPLGHRRAPARKRCPLDRCRTVVAMAGPRRAAATPRSSSCSAHSSIDRMLRAVIDVRRRGFDVTVVELEPALPPADASSSARRLWVLRHEARRAHARSRSVYAWRRSASPIRSRS